MQWTTILAVGTLFGCSSLAGAGIGESQDTDAGETGDPSRPAPDAPITEVS